jgi:transcription elongation factor GreA
MAEGDGEQLTGAQHQQLIAELAELEGPKRKAVIEAIATARGHGDLSENFEYHAAKNEQGLLERKITILRARLEDAVIVEGGDPEVISVGSRVVIEDGDRGRLEIEISGLGGQGTSSPSSPLGAALLGRRVGETVEVAAPKGSWQAKIVEIRAS